MNHPSTPTEQELQNLLIQAFEAQHNGDSKQAEQLYHYLISCIPEYWQLYYNLGLLLFEQERCEEALEVYRQGVSLPGADSDLFFNYALCLKKQGLVENALAVYDQILSANPDDIDSLYNRGGCLMALERYEEAISAYEKVTDRDATHQSALNNRAYLCHRLGRNTDATACYRQILDINPDHPAADYMLAALSSRPRTNAPASYVRVVFDQFSDHYEKSLIQNLGYRLPEIVLSTIIQENNEISFSSFLDLGCGTGLLGPHFRGIVQTMHGVDLSSKMIEKARQKKIYDQLFNEEINVFLSTCPPQSYNLLIAADVFSYIGELEETFNLSYRASSRDALFCFSVEDLPGPAGNFQLQKSGRFSHAREYIERSARISGWEVVSSEQLDLRREADKWIRGCLYKMIKVS